VRDQNGLRAQNRRHSAARNAAKAGSGSKNLIRSAYFSCDRSWYDHMLATNEIIKIANDVAAANLTSSSVSSILSESTVDSEGREALRITIVIEPGAAAKIMGDAVLDTLVQIQDRLREAGEERFPIVEYATKEELEESGDS
jgi:hypothetical protein